MTQDNVTLGCILAGSMLSIIAADEGLERTVAKIVDDNSLTDAVAIAVAAFYGKELAEQVVVELRNMTYVQLYDALLPGYSTMMANPEIRALIDRLHS